MYRFELHQVHNVLDTYIRQANKYWSKNNSLANKNEDAELKDKL